MSKGKYGLQFRVTETIGIGVYNPSAVSGISLFVNMVECDSADGLGCGRIWIEFDGKSREFCPGCGRRNKNGNVIVNSDNCPDVRGLDRKGIMVVWNEEEF